MYNGIGLSTARGSGTNGYIQTNRAFLKNVKEKVDYKSEEELAKLDQQINKQPNEEILDHERKRKVELKCIEMQELMEEQGYTEEEIERKVTIFRKMLMEKEGVSAEKNIDRDESGRPIAKESHQIAEANQEKNLRLRDAFGLSPDYVDGSSMQRHKRKEEEKAAAEMSKKQYSMVRSSSSSRSPSPVPKKKKKKTSSRRSRSNSRSPRRERKKKSKKHKRDRRRGHRRRGGPQFDREEDESRYTKEDENVVDIGRMKEEEERKETDPSEGTDEKVEVKTQEEQHRTIDSVNNEPVEEKLVIEKEESLENPGYDVDDIDGVPMSDENHENHPPPSLTGKCSPKPMPYEVPLTKPCMVLKESPATIQQNPAVQSLQLVVKPTPLMSLDIQPAKPIFSKGITPAIVYPKPPLIPAEDLMRRAARKSRSHSRRRSRSHTPSRRSRRSRRHRRRRKHRRHRRKSSKRRSRSYSRSHSRSSHSRSPSRSPARSHGSNSHDHRDSRSPSIRRRHGSPSHLDSRRITSARKRPVPYYRPSTSDSSSDDDDSSHSSYHHRHRHHRSWSASSRSSLSSLD